MSQRALGLALSLGVLVGAAACSDADEAPGAAPSSSSEETGSDQQRISPPDLATAPALRKAKGAREHNRGGDCGAAPGDQAAEGELVNRRPEVADYVVVVSWANGRSDVLARSVHVEEDLAPGARAKWRVVADVPDGVTSCSVNVRRGSLVE